MSANVLIFEDECIRLWACPRSAADGKALDTPVKGVEFQIERYWGLDRADVKTWGSLDLLDREQLKVAMWCLARAAYFRRGGGP